MRAKNVDEIDGMRQTYKRNLVLKKSKEFLNYLT